VLVSTAHAYRVVRSEPVADIDSGTDKRADRVSDTDSCRYSESDTDSC